MCSDTIKSGLPWMMSGLIIGHGGSAALTATPVNAPAEAAEGVERAMLPERGGRSGHGDYCLVPELGTYFYGCDLREGVDTNQAFEAWSEVHGGSVGWEE